MDNEVLKAIRERRSIRRFKPEQVTDEELKTILEAGTWAPTGHGSQDPWIVAVQNEALRKRLTRLNAQIMGVAATLITARPPWFWCLPARIMRTTIVTVRSY